MTIKASIRKASLFLSFLTLLCAPSFGAARSVAPIDADMIYIPGANSRSLRLCTDERILMWICRRNQIDSKRDYHLEKLGTFDNWAVSVGLSEEDVEKMAAIDRENWRSGNPTRAILSLAEPSLFRTEIGLEPREGRPTTLIVTYQFALEDKRNKHLKLSPCVGQVVLTQSVDVDPYQLHFLQEVPIQGGQTETVKFQKVSDSRVKTKFEGGRGRLVLDDCAIGEYAIKLPPSK